MVFSAIALHTESIEITAGRKSFDCADREKGRCAAGVARRLVAMAIEPPSRPLREHGIGADWSAIAGRHGSMAMITSWRNDSPRIRCLGFQERANWLTALARGFTARGASDGPMAAREDEAPVPDAPGTDRQVDAEAQTRCGRDIVHDRVLTPMIRALHEDNRLNGLATTARRRRSASSREPWMGGTAGSAADETSGSPPSPMCWASLAVAYQIPLIMIVYERGQDGEFNLGHKQWGAAPCGR